MNTTAASTLLATVAVSFAIMLSGCEQSSAPATATPATDAAGGTDVDEVAAKPPPEPVRVKVDQPRAEDWAAVRACATGWLDALEVDAPALDGHGINGIKKFSELLWAYWILHEHTDDDAERARIKQRAAALAAQSATLEYHTLDTCTQEEFNERILPYLLVARLVHAFGLNSGTFKQMITMVESRVRQNMLRRGERPRTAAADLYRAMGLEPPEVLTLTPPGSRGVLARRVPVESLSIKQGYELTHDVYVAFDYGERRTQDRLSDEDIEYLHEVLPGLINECIRRQYPDLLAEVLSCMIYLGWQSDPIAQRGIEYLLDNQNDNGTWGNYEVLRAQYGNYVDQQMYLHTVQVALRALCESYDGGWPPKPAPTS